jgi:plasmid stabilization system protein ParE
VATIIYSPRALDHLERAFDHIAERNLGAAVAAATAIRTAVEMLTMHPFIGRRVEKETRELVISFGSTGYIALYRYIAARDEIRVLAIRHQRQLDYPA